MSRTLELLKNLVFKDDVVRAASLARVYTIAPVAFPASRQPVEWSGVRLECGFSVILGI